MIYLIGSLRNSDVPKIGKALRENGFEVFEDWYAAGKIADDSWRDYELGRGRSYVEALQGYAATHVFNFDKKYLDLSDTAVLVLPAGKSGHLEFGYMIGKGSKGYILLPPQDQCSKLPEAWKWLAGIYEGEGSITRNGKRTGHGMQLTVTMKDEDVVRRLLAVSGVGSVEGPYARDNPAWSVMWRWAVRKRHDILYVLSSIWNELGKRRRKQALKVFEAAGVSEEHLQTSDNALEFRFDVMYRFATSVCQNVDELLLALKD